MKVVKIFDGAYEWTNLMPAVGFKPSTFQLTSSGFSELLIYSPVSTMVVPHLVAIHLWNMFGVVAGIQVLTWTRTTLSMFFQGSRLPTACATASHNWDCHFPSLLTGTTTLNEQFKVGKKRWKWITFPFKIFPVIFCTFVCVASVAQTTATTTIMAKTATTALT